MLIVSFIIGLCCSYIENLQKKHENDAQANFVNIVSSMRKATGGYLISHQQSCGFCRNIELVNGQSYMLIRRIVSLSNITDSWVFPSDYADVKLSLINSDGDYIICSASMKNNNVWEFISSYNDSENSGISTDTTKNDKTHQIRAKVGNAISIIVVSAYEWTEIEENAVEAGANGFINKPFSRSAVHAKMLEILNIKSENETTEDNPFEYFSGFNLLIAEDNDLNWEIIHEVFDNYNINSERSDNEKLNTIHIIAMTTDAFAEDIRACLDAGMNGHIAKPLDIKKYLMNFEKQVLQKENDFKYQNI